MVGLAAELPKLSPVIVTSEPPVPGAFSSCTLERTGALKVKPWYLVPTIADTVTAMNFSWPIDVTREGRLLCKQFRLVDEVQCDVVHG